ncbi:hypothetical protein KIH27_20675 [Mycobacterium sp. M1]|uniref:Uncharacterized protein n=1 Tax=Mycolicibacter acidiphilus TaxID=2835306 RepID=A0ABS5RNX9_9MYCO|nr:hypothetical protein [Mycolicibacter acidiphilus]MBS9536002.1 hypothetical protein [Mycolicibacter acidiphilus]
MTGDPHRPVPPGALVLTPDIEEVLLGNAFGAEAARFAAEVEQSGYQHAGTTVGALLSWLWEAGGDAAVRWLARYATTVADALAARGIARPPFDPLWRAVRLGLNFETCSDPAEQIAAFEAAARTHLADFTEVFTAAELAGHDRARGAADPWPDTTATGRCFAKKRWRDVRVGDFVPARAGVDLDYDDGWCRVEQFDAGQILLRDATGQRSTVVVDDSSAWLPVRTREPWQWGLPR